MKIILETRAELESQLPFAIVEDAEATVWQKRPRVYGSSWYQPGDGQPHGARDIALPAELIRSGHPDLDDEGAGE